MTVTCVTQPSQFKDDVLHWLAEKANVAQFVSFDPHGCQRHCRVQGYGVDHRFPSITTAAEALLGNSGSVNIRTYEPEKAKSRDFIYGIRSARLVATHIAAFSSQGLYTIVNETIDVNDGGVSGVALGNLIEFSPNDTPRCVEPEHIEKYGYPASFPKLTALSLLETVYGFHPDLSHYQSSQRVEFSIHPLRKGMRNEHTIVWEVEDVGEFQHTPKFSWPNRFSRFIGDKAFGLLVANTLRFPVPSTKVFPRSLPPFHFGLKTGSGETWIRTCPIEQQPGRYTTKLGWIDPYLLMQQEDPERVNIASILAQEGVDPQYSGSLIVDSTGNVIIEGVRGRGDAFMDGRFTEKLPPYVKTSVDRLYDEIADVLGPVRFEWVYDGDTVWIVQLHMGATTSFGNIIYPGDAAFFHRFAVAEGIDALRKLIQRTGPNEGIILVGFVGISSHLGDLLRKAKIPSRIEAPEPLVTTN